MRQTVPIFLLLALLLSPWMPSSAEVIVSGFLPDSQKGPLTAIKAPPKGKGLVLAHVFNGAEKAMQGGSYQLGIEITGSSNKRVFLFNPRTDIQPGGIKTFPLMVPMTSNERKGVFRVFSKAEGLTSYSDSFSLSRESLPTSGGESMTLFTEAPPEGQEITPPAEVPFEGESPVSVGNTVKGAKKPSSAALKGGKTPHPANHGTAAAPTRPAPKPEPSATRTIDPSEFKTLRTIDEELVIYVFKKGDTLKSVADRYYGDKTKEQTIADLNFIENTSSIRVGEEIIVDVKPLGKAKKIGDNRKTEAKNADQKKQDTKKQEAGTGKPQVQDSKKKGTGTSTGKNESVSTVQTVEAREGSFTYVVQPGDTLGKIAKKFLGKTSHANKLLKANPALNPKNLKVGTAITIPAFPEKA